MNDYQQLSRIWTNPVPSDVWQEAPDSIPFPERGIHIWRAKIPAPPPLLHDLKAKLSPEEHVQAERFRFDRDRHSFITCRGIVRTLLGHYLGCSPGNLQLATNPFGKPEMRKSSDRCLYFNISHSNQLALFAFSGICDIGIDLEFMEKIGDVPTLVTHFFSSKEVAEWHTLANSNQSKVFYTGWTRKESFIKAHGQGLSFPLKDFSVPLDPERHHCQVEIASCLHSALEWMVMDLPIDPLYCAAITYRVTSLELELWNFPSRPLPYEPY